MGTFVCIILILCSFIMTLQDVNGEFKLIGQRTDLLYPTQCYQYQSFGVDRKFCACNSWLPLHNYSKLNILYNDSTGNSMIEPSPQTYMKFYIYHPFGRFTGLPNNICNFEHIVMMDLSYNTISLIDEISCVENLDTLILKGNKIEYLKNTTFLGMKFLRIIDLSYNSLKYIEPGFLYNMDGDLLEFDVSYNILTSVDVTNIVFGKQEFFCKTDFSHNKIQSISNVLKWTCPDKHNFGEGGFVDLSNNILTHFFNFSEIGLKDMHQLGKLLYYGFDLRVNNWNCDCRFYAFLKAAAPFLAFIHRSYFDLTCTTPPEFAGKQIISFITDKTLDQLICNLSIAQKCPPTCRCFDQPDLKRTVVNCSGIGMSKIPPALPDRLYLDVDLSNNKISNLVSIIDMNYIGRITKINLTKNKLLTLPETMFSRFRHITVIDLRFNDIVRIPRALQMMNPCQVLLSSIEMKCTCYDNWIINWLPEENDECWGNIQVYCIGTYGKVHISNMSKELLGCSIQQEEIDSWVDNLLLTTCLAIFILSFMLFTFRFEIFILTRQIFKSLKQRTILPSAYTYDVYISCNEEDDTLRLWLNDTFVPYLEDQNLQVFLPYRDCDIGRPREEEIIEVTPKCLNFVFFLSEKYKGSIKMWVQKEWKYGWHNYKSDLNKEIVIVNYDMLKCSDMSKKYLGAFLRLQQFIDFSNRNNLIKENITSFLEIPASKKDISQSSSSNTDSNDLLLNDLDIFFPNDDSFTEKMSYNF